MTIKKQGPNHRVTIYDGDNRISLGQVAVEEKSHDIATIPVYCTELIAAKALSVEMLWEHRQILAMRLAVKRNQGSLYDDTVLYFSDVRLLTQLVKSAHHCRTLEKVRGRLNNVIIGRLMMSSEGQGLILSGTNGVAWAKNTITKDGRVSEEMRYYLISFKKKVETFALRSWSLVGGGLILVLDVVYREDHNQTLNKRATFNLNAICKICLS